MNPGMNAASQLALIFYAAAAEPEQRIVFDQRSPYERILVIDEGPLRYLRFGEVSGDHQSVIDTTDPRAVPMAYIRLALHGLSMPRQLRRALVIGLGGGTFPMAARRLAPDLRLDVVDIDPLVYEVAQKYFGLVTDEHLRVIIEDGARFVARSGPAYDLVLLDAYGESGIPPPLGSVAFFEKVKARLAPGGVVIANLSVDEEAERELAARFAGVFGPTQCVQTQESGNLLLVAGKDLPLRTPAELAARSRARGVPEPDAILGLRPCPAAKR